MTNEAKTKITYIDNFVNYNISFRDLTKFVAGELSMDDKQRITASLVSCVLELYKDGDIVAEIAHLGRKFVKTPIEITYDMHLMKLVYIYLLVNFFLVSIDDLNNDATQEDFYEMVFEHYMKKVTNHIMAIKDECFDRPLYGYEVSFA